MINFPFNQCFIDEFGNFKYIQIKITSKIDKNQSKIIIRGSGDFSYHKGIYKNFISPIIESSDKSLFNDWEYKCIGGGRIEFKNNKIYVYGTSGEYGTADHKITKEILEKFYPNKKIELNDN
jgi:phosphohistidine phosphatase